jgi:hypothetical protein
MDLVWINYAMERNVNIVVVFKDAVRVFAHVSERDAKLVVLLSFVVT